MKTTFLYTLVLFLVSALSTPPQRVIYGQITDRHDGAPLPGVKVNLKGTGRVATTDANGKYSIEIPASGAILIISFIGYTSLEVPVGDQDNLDIQLSPDAKSLSEVVITGERPARARKELSGSVSRKLSGKVAGIGTGSAPASYYDLEAYADVGENIFYGADKKPLSTFSIDVDAASYSNLRRFINNGQVPPKEAIRIEEMINYFDYDYAEPQNGQPFKVNMEIAAAPWNDKHQLVRIGLQGKRVPVQTLSPGNLVFLIDVSGSMDQPNKLPLVKKSFQILLDQLRDEDHVAIVIYAGAAGVVLEPTPGSEKRKILAALENLRAGGSTAGGQGLRMAYTLAREHFNEKGNNRIILATDGDFNVGESSNEAMEELIETKLRKEST